MPFVWWLQATLCMGSQAYGRAVLGDLTPPLFPTYTHEGSGGCSLLVPLPHRGTSATSPGPRASWPWAGRNHLHPQQSESTGKKPPQLRRKPPPQCYPSSGPHPREESRSQHTPRPGLLTLCCCDVLFWILSRLYLISLSVFFFPIF